MATIAQLLMVVEKLSFFESAILIFLIFCFIPIQINLKWYLLCVPPIANPGGPSKTPPMVQAVPATTPPFTDS